MLFERGKKPIGLSRDLYAKCTTSNPTPIYPGGEDPVLGWLSSLLYDRQITTMSGYMRLPDLLGGRLTWSYRLNGVYDLRRPGNSRHLNIT